jgi:hypothetical protein
MRAQSAPGPSAPYDNDPPTSEAAPNPPPRDPAEDAAAKPMVEGFDLSRFQYMEGLFGIRGQVERAMENAAQASQQQGQLDGIPKPL